MIENLDLDFVFSYQLRTNVEHQSGNGTQAPMMIYADADYEPGDGSTGLYEKADSTLQPAIIYVRGDQYLNALTTIRELQERINALQNV